MGRASVALAIARLQVRIHQNLTHCSLDICSLTMRHSILMMPQDFPGMTNYFPLPWQPGLTVSSAHRYQWLQACNSYIAKLSCSPVGAGTGGWPRCNCCTLIHRMTRAFAGAHNYRATQAGCNRPHTIMMTALTCRQSLLPERVSVRSCISQWVLLWTETVHWEWPWVVRKLRVEYTGEDGELL